MFKSSKAFFIYNILNISCLSCYSHCFKYTLFSDNEEKLHKGRSIYFCPFIQAKKKKNKNKNKNKKKN